MSDRTDFKAALSDANKAARRYRTAVRKKRRGEPVDVGDEETGFAVRAIAVWDELVAGSAAALPTRKAMSGEVEGAPARYTSNRTPGGSMPINTRTFFGFKDKTTGEVLRLHERCDQYSLTDDTGYPVFEAKSLEQLANILFDDTPGYNSSPALPGWGGFKLEQLAPVKVTISQECEELVLPDVASVTTIEVRTIAYLLARNYAGGEFERDADKPGLVFWLVELPEGETLESAKRWVNGPVFGGDRYTKRHLYAVVALPEEYVPLTVGKRACALFIASGTYL